MNMYLIIHRYLCAFFFMISSLSASDRNVPNASHDINNQSSRIDSATIYTVTFLRKNSDEKQNRSLPPSQELRRPNASKVIRDSADTFIQRLRNRWKNPCLQEDIKSYEASSDCTNHSSNDIVFENGNLLITQAVSVEEQRKNRRHAFLELGVIATWFGIGGGSVTAAPAAVTGFWAFMSSVGTGAIFANPAVPAVAATIGGGIWGFHKLKEWKNGSSGNNDRKSGNSHNGSGNKNNNNKDPKGKGTGAITAAAANEIKKKKKEQIDPHSWLSKKDEFEPAGKADYATYEREARRYESNQKHHQNSPVNIGKAPENGYTGVKNALPVKNKYFLIGVENGKIVQYNQHAPNTYHGYIVEDFFKLDAEARNTLVDAGLVRSHKSGKIAK